MFYSILWDFSSANLQKDLSVVEFLRLIEAKLFPGQAPLRKNAFIYLDALSYTLIDEAYKNKAKEAGFRIIESLLSRAKSDREFSEYAMKYIKKNEDQQMWSVLIAGERDYSPQFLNFLRESKKFKLVFDKNVNFGIKKVARSSLSMEKLNLNLNKIKLISSESESDDVPSASPNFTETSGHRKTLVPEDDPKTLAPKYDEKTMVPEDNPKPVLPRDDQKANPDEFKMYGKRLAGDRLLYTFTYDARKRDKLVKTLDACLNVLKGKINSCWEGVGTLEFSSTDSLINGKNLLESLSEVYGVKMTSITIIGNNGEVVANLADEDIVRNKANFERFDEMTGNRNKNIPGDSRKDQAVNSRAICLITYDKWKKEQVQSCLKGTLYHFNGKLLSCWDGIGTLAFGTKQDVENARSLLESLSTLGVKITSVNSTRETGGNSDSIRKQKVHSGGDNLKSFEDEVNFADFHKSEPFETPKKTSNLSNDFKGGYFLLFSGLKKRTEISWYRQEIRKLLEGIDIKFLFFDRKSDEALIEFHAKYDADCALNRLKGTTLPEHTYKLNPRYATDISDDLFERIQDSCPIYQRFRQQSRAPTNLPSKIKVHRPASVTNMYDGSDNSDVEEGKDCLNQSQDFSFVSLKREISRPKSRSSNTSSKTENSEPKSPSSSSGKEECNLM